MEEKSYVGMGFTVCPYCGKENEEKCVLIDKRMRPTLGRRNFIGMELCDEHKKLAEEKQLVCLFAVNEMDGTIALHGPGALMSLNAFTEVFKTSIENGAPVPEIGQCVQMNPKMMDALRAAALQAELDYQAETANA